MDNKVMTGALALVRSGGKICGLMRSISATENMQRGSVQGLGTVYDSEKPLTKIDCSLTCDFMEIDFSKSGVPGAIRRDFENVLSQVVSGGTSLEDQLVLDSDGVQVDIFKKVSDVIDPVTGNIKPKLQPYATCYNCFITSDSFNISENQVAGHNQSFAYLKSIQFLP
jgi:hypothetical protein